MPKIARVIYNRLEGDETNGLLQIDATVNYAADNKLGAVPTTADLELDSPYNTYQNPGLPPTPIEAPGDDAMRPRPTPPTATGTTTSRSTSRPARPSSPRPTTSS